MLEEKRMLSLGLLILLLGVAFGVIGDSVSSVASFQWSFLGATRERLISENTYIIMRVLSYAFISVGQIALTAGILITSFALYSISLSRKREKWYGITFAVMATLLLIFTLNFVIGLFLRRW